MVQIESLVCGTTRTIKYIRLHKMVYFQLVLPYVVASDLVLHCTRGLA